MDTTEGDRALLGPIWAAISANRGKAGIATLLTELIGSNLAAHRETLKSGLEAEQINVWTRAEASVRGEDLDEVLRLRADYERHSKEGTSFYFNLVLSLWGSDPGGIPDAEVDLMLAGSLYEAALRGTPRAVEDDYEEATGTLVVDYRFPSQDEIPAIRSISYVQKRDGFVKSYLPRRQRDDTYDDYLYQVVLRSLYWLYSADYAGALSSVVFNGWIESKDRATGKDHRACILSVMVKREEFRDLDLRYVDPKACFRALKGVAATNLHRMVPVAPIQSISREDKRFIEGREVIASVAGGDNLAAMKWEDFEHLVRELFDEEFRVQGGEVRITRASRDRGVDAIVFDPDPVKGGKIVIQAKRYTNVVGVEAVRDLYGTVINEGAMKGILVTTADYGPDAYAFAKDKPLTLLNGGNLLHLLAKHGHVARIDLAEAKTLLADQ